MQLKVKHSVSLDEFFRATISLLIHGVVLPPSLGSARAIFQKARIEKNWQNEPIDSTHQDKPICTLEYMVWPIRTGRNLPLKK